MRGCCLNCAVPSSGVGSVVRLAVGWAWVEVWVQV